MYSGLRAALSVKSALPSFALLNISSMFLTKLIFSHQWKYWLVKTPPPLRFYCFH